MVPYLRRWTAFVGLTAHIATSTLAQAPAWWATQQVIVPGQQAQDFAVANLGQLKNLAAKAAAEMNASIDGGAGPEISGMIAAWLDHPEGANDFAVATIGQSKAVASMFYSRLGQPPPWTVTTTDDQDYSPINLGQLKMLFSFSISTVVQSPLEVLKDRGPRLTLQDATRPIQSLPQILRTTGEIGGVRDLTPPTNPQPEDAYLEVLYWEAAKHFMVYGERGGGTIYQTFNFGIPDFIAYTEATRENGVPVRFGPAQAPPSMASAVPIELQMESSGGYWDFALASAEWSPLPLESNLPFTVQHSAGSARITWTHNNDLFINSFTSYQKMKFRLHVSESLSSDYMRQVKVTKVYTPLMRADSPFSATPGFGVEPYQDGWTETSIRQLTVPAGGIDSGYVIVDPGVMSNFLECRISAVLMDPDTEPESHAGQVHQQDIAGASRRKVALNGIPLPDEPPQAAAESDQPKEESYIDAYSLGLVHSTSDVYVPQGASELPLALRRQAVDFSWVPETDVPLQDRVTQPFGEGWNSGVSSYVEFKKTNGDTTVTVFDENGGSQQFLVTGIDEFKPLPFSSNDAKSYMNTLVMEEDTSSPGTKRLVYTRKFGSRLVFESEATSSEYTNSEGYSATTYALGHPDSADGRHFSEGTPLPAGIDWDQLNVTQPDELPISVVSGSGGRLTVTDGNNRVLVRRTSTFSTGGLNWSERSPQFSGLRDPFQITSTVGTSDARFTVGVTSGRSIRQPVSGGVFSPGSTGNFPQRSGGLSHVGPAPGFMAGFHAGAGDLMGLFVSTVGGTITPKAQAEIYSGMASGLVYLNVKDRMDLAGVGQSDEVGWAAGYGQAMGIASSSLSLRSQLLKAQSGVTLPKVQSDAMHVTGAFLTLHSAEFRAGARGVSGPCNPFLLVNANNKGVTTGVVTPAPRPASSTGPSAYFTVSGGTDVASTTYTATSNRTQQPKSKIGRNRVGTFSETAPPDPDPGQPKPRITRVFYRLKTVSDRWGNTLEYTYGQNEGLIPSRIRDTKRGSQITIESTGIGSGRKRCVTRVVDPRGMATEYYYRTISVAGEGAALLERVTYADKSFIHYGYDHDAQLDRKTNCIVHHINLAAIINSEGDAWSFEYAFDASAAFEGNIGTSPENGGHPRWVKSITLPGGKAVSLSNERFISLSGSSEAFGKVTNTITDVDGNRRTYVFGGTQVSRMPTGLISALASRTTGIQDWLMFTTLDIHLAPGAVEHFEFDPQAGLALKKAVDLAGSTTTYEYKDEGSKYTPGNLNGFDIVAPAELFRYFDDPTAKIDALGGRTEYTYDTSTRVLKTVVDPLGRKTEYAVQPVTGLRTDERHYDASGQLLSQTDFEYSNSAFPAFMTAQIQRRMSTDPGWMTDRLTTYVPEASGRVKSETRSGINATTHYTYDANGNRLSVTDPLNRVTAFDYDARGRLSHVTYALGTSDEAHRNYVYDSRGNKTAEVDENNGIWFYRHDEMGRCIESTFDLNGNGHPDGADQDIVSRTDYNVFGQPTREINPNGAITEKEYDGLGRLGAVRTAVGTPIETLTEFYYEFGEKTGGTIFDNSTFKPNRVVDPRGYQTLTEYDALYRPVKVWRQYLGDANPGQAGAWALTENTYDAVGNLTAVRDPLGKVTLTTYDGLNHPTVTTYADNWVTRSSFTSTGLKWRAEDEMGRVTETRYDAADRAVEVRQPLMTPAFGPVAMPVVRTSYDNADNVLTVTDPRGNVTTTTYDARNRPVTITTPPVLDAVSGQMVPTVTRKEYDAAGKVVRLTDALGFHTDTWYDRAGRAIEVHSPPVPTMDGLAGAQRVITKSRYDKVGNIVEVTDGDGRVTRNFYDELNRLVQTTDPALIPNIFGYDASGNRTSVTDGLGHTTTFDYDGLNRVTSEQTPSGSITLSLYDEVNKTGQIMPDGSLITFTYDARHRLIDTFCGPDAEHHTARKVRSSTYDGAGNLLRVREFPETGVHAAFLDQTYTYDSHNRVLSEGPWSTRPSARYGYDLAGNRVYTQTLPGLQITTVFDALNRPLQILEKGGEGPGFVTRQTIYAYDKAGRLIQQTLPNGTRVVNSHDALGRLAHRFLYASGTAVVNVSQQHYLYDAAGNLRQMTELTRNQPRSRIVTLTYDASLRLDTETIREADGTTTVSDYNHDAAGNRTRLTRTKAAGAPEVTEYTYNTLNQLIFLQRTGSPVPAATHCTYDARGNRLTKGIDVYTWDWAGRMIAVDHESPGTATGMQRYQYGYDHRDRRVVRIEGETATLAMYAGGTSVCEYQYLPSPTPALTGFPTADWVATVPHQFSCTKLFVRGSDMGGGVGGLLYSRDYDQEYWASLVLHFNIGGSFTVSQSVWQLPDAAASNRFNHYNGRGDVVAQTDDSGTLTWTGSYEAYGTRTRETGTNPDRQRANTKEEDPTGLLNEGHRYRDLETGTWLSRDPAGFIDGPNLYAYVKQNPWSKFDPEGLHGWEVGPTMEQAAGRAIAEYVHNDPKQAASLAADFVPVVGTVKGITEAVGGKDPVTGKQLSNGEQAVAGVGAVASLLPGGKAVVKGLSKLFKGADKAADIAKTAKEVPDLVNSAKKVAQGADEAASRGARFGSASSKNYRGAFFEANPGLEGQVVVHHAVEQQALTRFPGTVTEAQIHSLENLRGIPKSINSDVHLSQIRKSWNEFYRNNPAPTQQQLLDHATNIDDQFGHLFNPLVR